MFFLLLEEILKLGEGVFILAKLSKAASGLSRSDSLSPRTSVATTCPANLIASPTMRSSVSWPSQGFCGTLITVPSCSRAKQWKIVLSAVGAQ